jgi:hypothetical protein
METEPNLKEPRSRIVLWVLVTLVFLVLIAGLLLTLGWIVNQAGEGT